MYGAIVGPKCFFSRDPFMRMGGKMIYRRRDSAKVRAVLTNNFQYTTIGQKSPKIVRLLLLACTTYPNLQRRLQLHRRSQSLNQSHLPQHPQHVPSRIQTTPQSSYASPRKPSLLRLPRTSTSLGLSHRPPSWGSSRIIAHGGILLFRVQW